MIVALVVVVAVGSGNVLGGLTLSGGVGVAACSITTPTVAAGTASVGGFWSPEGLQLTRTRVSETRRKALRTGRRTSLTAAFRAQITRAPAAPAHPIVAYKRRSIPKQDVSSF